MRILIFHGYLLRGTGSNVYNARLVPALARGGATVDLLSQDRRAHELPFGLPRSLDEALRELRVALLKGAFEPFGVCRFSSEIGLTKINRLDLQYW